MSWIHIHLCILICTHLVTNTHPPAHPTPSFHTHLFTYNPIHISFTHTVSGPLVYSHICFYKLTCTPRECISYAHILTNMHIYRRTHTYTQAPHLALSVHLYTHTFSHTCSLASSSLSHTYTHLHTFTATHFFT